ncbi:MAG: hypothetical protein PWP51_1034 [Clostridiales bacterium]|nr:hypothetical protein [Clostridiales bacterium]
MFDEKYIRQIKIDIPNEKKSVYPFLLDAVKNFPELSLRSAVSFFIGENGSGKSTLLEAIAVAYGFNAEGGSKHFNFATNRTHSILSEHIRLTKGIRKPQNGFFLRAESFYNVASHIDALDEDGVAPKIIDSYGGVSLHKQSHGESFMALVQNRFSGNGLYILDEPEAALSPTRQLALLASINDLVKKGSQFMIATHSPILMAYPDAVIYNVEDSCQIVKLEDTEHFMVTREFLNNREKMLAILLNSDD